MVAQLAAQARVAVAIVGELQESVLILDEVDLILHPLKSELNWPLGKRKPLDFGATRWAVPFHLLDALFYCSDGRCPTAGATTASAMGVLKSCRRRREGLDAKHLQRTPHLILSLAAFYNQRSRRRSAAGCCCCCASRGLRDLKDEQISPT